VPAAAPAESPPASAPSLSDDAAYAQFVASMPNDYDINYTYVQPAGGNRRPGAVDNGGGPSKANPRALGIAGGTFLTLGSVLGIVGIGLGAATASGGGNEELIVPAIGTGASGGALLILGASLLGAKRAARRKNGDLPSKPTMTTTQRKNAVLWGSIGLGFGIVGIAGGAVLVAKDEDSKGGATLLALGVLFTGISLWPIGRLLADRSRRNSTVRVSPAPLMVRRGGGLGVSGRF
jgi:hypothetical protein